MCILQTEKAELCILGQLYSNKQLNWTHKFDMLWLKYYNSKQLDGKSLGNYVGELAEFATIAGN